MNDRQPTTEDAPRCWHGTAAPQRSRTIMLDRIEDNGVRPVIVEDASRHRPEVEIGQVATSLFEGSVPLTELVVQTDAEDVVGEVRTQRRIGGRVHNGREARLRLVRDDHLRGARA